MLIALNEYCSDTTYSIIKVRNNFTFYAPNAFSPDNDDINDNFMIKTTYISNDDFIVYIYDRW